MKTKTTIALLYFCFLLSAFSFPAAAAPVSVIHTNGVFSDYTEVSAVQPAGKAVILQYSEDLESWYFLAYWDPFPLEQEVWIAWYTPEWLRPHHLFFRAQESVPVDFLQAPAPPREAFDVTRGTRKRRSGFRVPSSELKTGAGVPQPGTRNQEPGT